MSSQDPILFASWPVVPEALRPKKLYHAGLIEATQKALLEARGWGPVDVRVMPNKTDKDRAENLKAWLEGIRFGTIEVDPRIHKMIELEARVYSMTSGKGPAGKRSEDLHSDKDSTDFILKLGKSSKWATKAEEQKLMKKQTKRRK
jgi:hypothetical protein